MLKQFDICSGVGTGFPLAGLLLGNCQPIGFSEIDPFCCDILDRRFPGVRNYGDARLLPVREIGREHERIDLLTASPPSQPFSLQGKREGRDDPRDCFPAIKRAIESFRPTYFCIENTAGILSCPKDKKHKSLYLQHFLRQITRLGYDTEWITVNSGHFGSPFLRERFLLVGITRDLIDWQLVTPWSEQIGGTVEEKGGNQAGRGVKSPISRKSLLDSFGLDEPLGLKNGDGVTRCRRITLGNVFAPKLAVIAITRILYLDTLKHRCNRTW
jgi:DNA (cytosine-5)-methyltransferase 1